MNNLTNLEVLKLSSINLSNINDLSYMFFNLQSLISLDLSNINTSNIINMEFLFGNCVNLQKTNVIFTNYQILLLINYFNYY